MMAAGVAKGCVLVGQDARVGCTRNDCASPPAPPKLTPHTLFFLIALCLGLRALLTEANGI